MEKAIWIKELIKSEQQMEESGIIDMSTGFDSEKNLSNETIQFLLNLKTQFIEYSTLFNDNKPSVLGRIKIYGIAKTHADFMLFRNGFKMIFSFKSPGEISIRFNFVGSHPASSGHQSFNSVGALSSMNAIDPLQTSRDLFAEHIIEARQAAFGELIWSYQGQPAKIEYMVRYYLTLFLRESVK